MTQFITRFGLAQGAFLFAVFLLSHFIFGTNPENYGNSELFGYSMMIISCLAIFMATKSYKHNAQHGQLTFLQGCKLGLGVSAIASAIFAAYNYVYLTWINPRFLSDYQAWHRQQIENRGLPEAQINAQLAELAQSADMMQSTGFMLVIMYFTVFFIGGLFTLVTAATMKARSKLWNYGSILTGRTIIMSQSRVQFEVDEHIAYVTLNRPDKLNSLDLPMFKALIETAKKIRKDKHIRAVIISGAGESFCAGLDFQALSKDKWVAPKLFLKWP